MKKFVEEYGAIENWQLLSKQTLSKSRREKGETYLKSYLDFFYKLFFKVLDFLFQNINNMMYILQTTKYVDHVKILMPCSRSNF